MRHAPPHVLAAALLVQGCVAINSREACQVTKLAEIPLHVTNNQPIVDVMVGNRPARLILDTGATHTLLTDAAFARLGLNFDLNVRVTTNGVAGQALARMSLPVRFTIGELELPPTAVVSIKSATALSAISDIDGLLGIDTLAAQDLDIDLPKRRLGLYAPRQCPDGPAPFDGPSISYKTSPNPYHLLSVPALADGRALSLIVDTGATSSYVNRRRLGLPEAGDEPIAQTPSSGPGSLDARVHLFRSVTIADTTYHNASVLTGPMPFEQDGLLGIDFWKNRRLWLSFAGWSTTMRRLSPR